MAGADGPEAALAAERDRLRAAVASMEADMDRMVAASRGDNADDEHDPEGQTIAWERSQLAALTDDARRRLADVEAALARVADGSYGRCVVCGRVIPAGRLEARPDARTCVEHAGGAGARAPDGPGGS